MLERFSRVLRDGKKTPLSMLDTVSTLTFSFPFPLRRFDSEILLTTSIAGDRVATLRNQYQ